MVASYFKSENFNPLNDFVFVRPINAMNKDEEDEMSGIILTLSKNKSVVEGRPTNGEVLAVGPKCRYIKPGMQVYWDVTRGHDIECEDGTFILLIEETILGYKG